MQNPSEPEHSQEESDEEQKSEVFSAGSFGEDSGEEPPKLPDDVEDERAASLERMERAQRQVEQQEWIYKQIMAKIGKGEDNHDEDDSAAEGVIEQQEPFVLPPEALALLESTATGERYAHSRIVAEELLRRKIRYAKFQKNHNRRLDKAEEYRSQVNEKRMASEDRVLRRQREVFQLQREKAFLAQQKRGEQQKMLKEIQRDEDQRFDLLQEKHHPNSGSSQPQPPTGPRAGKAPPPPPGAPRPGSSPVVSDPVLNEQIYKDMCQSRTLYNLEFERWSKREQENEKRTEAHWKKMLSGSTRSKEEESKGSKGRSLFRRAVKEVRKINTYVAKAPFDRLEMKKMESLPSPGGTITSYDDESLDWTYPLQSSSLHSSTSLPEIRTPPKNEKWQARFERCQTHAQLFEEASLEKKANDQKKNEEARKRHLTSKMMRAAEASSVLDVWSKRCDQAEQNRQNASTNNEFAVLQKREDWSNKWNEEMASKDEERQKLADTSHAWRSQIKDQWTKQNITTESHGRARLAEKEERSVAQRQALREKDDRRLDKLGENFEAAREKALQKKKADEDFRRKTVKEIQAKESRSQRVMKTACKPLSTREALQRHRIRKEETGPKPAVTPKELALPPELTLSPSMALCPRVRKAAAPKQPGSAEPAAESADEDGSAAAAGADGNGSAAAPSSLATSAAVTSESFMPAGMPGNRASSKGFGHLTLNEESLRLFSKSLSEDDPDAELDFEVGEVSGEKKFIQKLKEWSTEELRIIRKKDAARPIAF